MLQFLVESPIWLKIVLGLLALPLVCLLMGLLVCLLDPSSVTASDNIMQLGATTTVIFALIGVTYFGIHQLLMSWFGLNNSLLTILLTLVIVFSGVIGFAILKNR